MTPTPKPGAVLFASGLQRMAQFYEQLLAWPRLHADAEHVRLVSEHMELVIHAIPPYIAATIPLSDPPSLREETAIKLMLPVASIAEARHRAAEWGGQLLPVGAEWADRGCIVCDGHDPEGNVFQLRQAVP